MIKINKQRKQAGFKNERLIVIPPKKIRKFLSHPLLKKLYITDIGFFPRAINHYRERDKGSKQNILIYCTQGKGFIRIKNKKYEINKNSILFIPKETPHIYGTDSNNPWDIYWGHFSGDSSQYYCPDLNKDNIHISSISFNKFSVLFNLFNSIFDLLERGFVLDNIIHSSQVFSNIKNVFYFFT